MKTEPVTEPAPPADDELAFGLAGLPDAPPVTAESTKPAVRWLTDKKRVESYALAYPFELDGVEYRTITIKRLTGAEVAAFMEKMRDAPQGTSLRYPLFFVERVEISDAAWAALDDDDRLALEAIASDFLPARFR